MNIIWKIDEYKIKSKTSKLKPWDTVTNFIILIFVYLTIKQNISVSINFTIVTN